MILYTLSVQKLLILLQMLDFLRTHQMRKALEYSTCKATVDEVMAALQPRLTPQGGSGPAQRHREAEGAVMLNLRRLVQALDGRP